MRPRRDALGSVSKGQRLAFAAAFVFVLAGAAATWIAVIERLRAPDPVAVRGTPAAIVWSERVFRSEAELAAWLRGRGINYARWVRKHPAAVSILRSRDRTAAEAVSRRARRAERTARPAQRPAAGGRPAAVVAPPDAQPPQSSPGGDDSSALPTLLFFGALALSLLALGGMAISVARALRSPRSQRPWAGEHGVAAEPRVD